MLRKALATLLLLQPLLLWSQDFPLNPLSITELESTEGKWKSIGDLTIHPISDEIKTEKGKTVLFANEAGQLTSKVSYGDFKLEFEMMQSAKTRANLVLGNAIKLNLNATSTGNKPYIGTVNNTGQALQNVCAAPGLWQKVELTYVAPKAGKPAILERLRVNGVTLHENVFDWSVNGEEAPLKFNLEKGALAIRNLAISGYGDEKPVALSNIKYSLEETENFRKIERADKAAPKTGELPELTFRVQNDFSQYLISLTGDLEVAEEGDYAFTLEYQGIATFKIDGKDVAGFQDFNYRVPSSGLVHLTKGTHSFEYNYTKAWWPSGLGLFVSGPTFRPYALHSVSSLPDIQKTGGIFVEPNISKAKLIRSFMDFEDEKRTEVITVGSGLNRHYSYDLENGSLLYIWKGDFADVTEMWYERGEPQIIEPLGQTVQLDGKSAFSLHGQKESVQLDEYYTDKAGIPTFNHSINGSLVSQKFIPTKSGLTVEVGSETDEASYKVASGKDIRILGNGLYQLDGYYVQLPEDIKVSEKQEGDETQLWANANELQSFEIIW
ncbi:hypothetical protein [Jiulongibacter sp. NS-SX5]|uniref:hypothetical protein n=1 Tax=Jiulongibacter sp. NS-SX5 TaxID=3463854 RepID=UPI0040581B6D